MKVFVPLVLLSGLVAASPAATTACKKPSVRKEWRDLSKAEKKAFIDASKCLGTVVPSHPNFFRVGEGDGTYPLPVPANKRTLWDDFTYSHMDTNHKTHFVGAFLPWHRMYLATFEKALQDHCGYKGGIPYWDWTLDIADLEKAAIFDSDPVYGLGTWGKAENNWTVTDGAFSNWTRVYPTPHVIARRYEARPFQVQGVYPLPYDEPNKLANVTITPKAIKSLIQGHNGDAFGFQFAIEGKRCEGLHSALHYIFGSQSNVGLPGSDMGDASHSPNDPVFFLHHANIDRIWQKWKDYHPSNAKAIGGGTIKNLTAYDEYPQGLPPATTPKDSLVTNGLAKNVTIEELYSTTQGYTCYTYQDPKDAKY